MTTYDEPIIKATDFVPSFEVREVRSQFGRSYKVPTIILNAKADGQNSYILQGKPYNRFLHFMSSGKRKFTRTYRKDGIWSFADSNQWLRDAYEKSVTPEFKLLIVDGSSFVARITSAEYIGVPHSFIKEVVENRLTNEGMEFELKSTRFGAQKMMWTIKNTDSYKGTGMIPAIHCVNQNSGDRSLKFFAGGMVLVCSNGMVIEGEGQKIRLVHKLDLAVVRRTIETIIGDLMQKIEILPKEFLKLREIKVTFDEAKQKVGTLPIAKYLQDAVIEQLKVDQDGTMWGVYMACTWVGSHLDQIQKGKRVLQLNEVKSTQLQSLQLLTTDWEAKEKESETI